MRFFPVIFSSSLTSTVFANPMSFLSLRRSSTFAYIMQQIAMHRTPLYA